MNYPLNQKNEKPKERNIIYNLRNGFEEKAIQGKCKLKISAYE